MGVPVRRGGHLHNLSFVAPADDRGGARRHRRRAGFRPDGDKAWQRPHSDSITTFALNSVKFIPAFFAMNNLSLATCVMPTALVVANAAVALIIYARWRNITKYRHPEVRAKQASKDAAEAHAFTCSCAGIRRDATQFGGHLRLVAGGGAVEPRSSTILRNRAQHYERACRRRPRARNCPPETRHPVPSPPPRRGKRRLGPARTEPPP